MERPTIMSERISDEELNDWIKIPKKYVPSAKKWIRINALGIDTYVGDRLYVITQILSEDFNEDKIILIKEKVLKYLEDEGFINYDYLYIGVLEVKLKE